MASAKWNTFPHLTAAQLKNADKIPISDESQPDGDKDATTTIEELRAAIGGGGAQPAEGLIVVQHGTNNSAPRPTAAMVVWRGSADPTNAFDGDLWDDSSGWDA